MMAGFDMILFLKTVPGVIGVAGFMAFLMRKHKPESDHEIVNVVNAVRDRFLLIGCAALILLSAWLIYRAPPPDHDAPEAFYDAGERQSRLS